jgi:hypothetical protein
MAAAPTLLYCLGATKAGTSWLHRYVSDHPQTRMPSIKELHYWDSVATGGWDFWIRDTAAKHRDHIGKAETDNHNKRERQLRMAGDALAWLEVVEGKRRDDDAYLSFLHRRVRGHRLVGDMTPAYGLLSADWLREMAGVAPEVRFVYLLRDPVERLWSHCRMIAKRRAEGPEDVPARANNILRRTLSGKEEEIAARSDYAGALGRMRAAIPAGQLHFAFYEELFTVAEVARLCAFLGLDPAPADFDHVVMPSPAADMTPDNRAAARDWLAPQYDAAAEIFDRLPASWGTAPAEVGQ